MPGIRVRARALDMLGRQQIAGVPTAISELFKNAHDAYAHRVEVDFFRSSGLFVLRDDGIGMSYQDFVDRWLTLGTESKLAAGFGLNPPPSDPDQDLRPIMGEKGIGRLAIAAIGPQVLVLTRSKAEPDELVVAFINWGVFRLPGVDLSDIHIPIRALPGGTLPSRALVAELVAEVHSNVVTLARDLPESHLTPILAELAHLDLDPRGLYPTLPRGPTLIDEGCGTHFIILPTEETLPEDIDGSPNSDIAPALIKVLIGFTNTMASGRRTQAIQARFRDHALDGTIYERIAGSAFFTPEEFEKADHHVSGSFDDFGQFRGTVQVYGRDPVEYLLPWPEARGRRLRCGPLKINFAYVQGQPRVTRMPPEDHARLKAKLNRIGGLYIYRDGIRILPYGNSDYDFLNIEQRRTKSASYYYFSYRRIFGVIDITREENPNLVEKAGREGFRENLAYRQLKRLLEHFFVQLAGEFFRVGGLHAEDFLTTRDDLERNERLRRRREKQVRVRRAKFGRDLDAFFESVNAREPEAATAQLLEEARNRFDGLAVHEGREDLAQHMLDLESESHSALLAIQEEYWVSRPRGFGLTRRMQSDWEAYRLERSRLTTKVWEPAAVELAAIVSRQTTRLRADIDYRRRLSRVLSDASDAQLDRATFLGRDTRAELREAQGRVVSETRDRLAAVHNAIRETLSDFERTDTSSLAAADFDSVRTQLERRIAEVGDVETANLESLREHVRLLGTQEGLELPEVTDALEEELEALRERESAGLQLAQVGMALGIVHHEFASAIQGIRTNLRLLKPWSDANEKLSIVYRDIRANFDHLDGYLTLFTPLDRRLQRRRVRIRGSDVYHFLMDLFGQRLKRHEVELSATDAFREAEIVGFPSSFYPCFVNLVDNAIFWVSSRDRGRERVIELDATGGAFLVGDSGPGIPPRDAASVFEMGFTRRPGGRGMGLYISRQILKEIGYELKLDRFVEGEGAQFRISPTKEDSEAEQPRGPRRKDG